MSQTILALATPKIKSALAIIRLSGDDSLFLFQKIFSKDITKVNKREVFIGDISYQSKNIDQVVAIIYVAPHSFTGENMVEIISHGSMVIVEEIINTLISLGVRLAYNGEFSSRAFYNNKIDLLQAEAINDIVNATSLEAKDLALSSLNGETSKLFRPIKNQIADLLSNIEVNIDYPEYEDIEIVSKNRIINETTQIISDLENLLNKSLNNKVYFDGVKVVLVGESNVGKSSLLNALLDEDKAIVTDISGTTRDIVEGYTNINGVTIHLFDTAGINANPGEIEKLGINKTYEIIKKADLILYVLDNINNTNKDILNLIKNMNHLIIYNKADLISKKDKNKIYVSALNKDISSLKQKIIKCLNLDKLKVEPSFINERQIGLVKKMLIALKKAKEDAINDVGVDLISSNLQIAYQCGLELLGENNQTNLMDEIFSRFCVGK